MDTPADRDPASAGERLPIKLDPRYGHFPWWPEDGDDWLHPEDVALARRSIPSPRIWRREGDQADFALLQYGDLRLRVRPRLWQETPKPAFEIGDLVEVLPRGMHNDPTTGHIREVLWDDHTQQIHFQIKTASRLVETHYTADDLKLVDRTKPEDPPCIVAPTDDDGDVAELVEGLEVDEHRRRGE